MNVGEREKAKNNTRGVNQMEGEGNCATPSVCHGTSGSALSSVTKESMI